MSTACMHIEENDEFVFVVPSSKKDQSPIIFGRVRYWITPSNNLDEDLEPLNSFTMHGQHTVWWKKWDTTRQGEGLNFERGRRIPLQPFVPKEKSANYYDQTRRGLGYTSQSVQSDLESKKPLLSHSSYLSDWESDVSMGVAFKKLFVNIISTSQVEPGEDIGPFNTDPWAEQLDLQWEKGFEQRDPPAKDKVIQIDVGD